MKIEGYVVTAKFENVDCYLSGSKWVHDIQKIKLRDIKVFPQEVNMTKWPEMDQSYRNAKISISIES
ncbi:MAG: hypothetical protein WC554_12015 [Clostridia bacterium]|jgi:hypothetical protein